MSADFRFPLLPACWLYAKRNIGAESRMLKKTYTLIYPDPMLNKFFQAFNYFFQYWKVQKQSNEIVSNITVVFKF